MAIDSHHLLPQLFSNREVTMNTNNNQIGYGVVSPFFVPDDSPSLYGGDNTLPTTTYFADGGDGGPFFPTQTRKRSRDSSFYNLNHHQHQNQNLRSSSSSCVSNTNTTPYSFLGQDIDISSHINQQHHEIDRFVSLHMERVRFEIEEKRKKQARTIMEAIEQGLVKRLRVKEEERDRIGRLNHALEERVKSLSVENQIWRDLAQSNEATANNLRNNLEQVLAQVNNIPGAGLGNGEGDVANVREEDEGDAESCCGSCSEEETVRKRRIGDDVAAYDSRRCRNCGEEESCVLLLPCRHLCLCGVCGSSVHTCPICRTSKNASVHVNMSSS